MSGNAARLGRSVHLCLCKTPGQDRLAALLLLVQGEAEPTGEALGPTADAGVLRCPGCRPDPPDVLGADQVTEFESQVRSMYDQMARISIEPVWARFFDFGAGRMPSFLTKLAGDA